MFFTLLSALLLILSFPKFSLWPLAWFAFVPVFYAVRRDKTFANAFLHFYLFGFLFFFTSVEWLRHVAYFGWVFVATAYAVYFGLFGLVVHWFWRRSQFCLSLLVLPSSWCVLEWIRAEVPVWGFGWNLLAYSQSFNLTIASIGNLIGAYGLSWLVVFANLAIFFVLDFELGHKKQEGVVALIGILSLALIFSVYFTLSARIPLDVQSDQLRVAIVQGNIPQIQKWDENFKLRIIETHEKLTSLIARKEQDRADLIIWPEAAYPGFFNVDEKRERISILARELETPVLLGGLHWERTDSGNHYFNSAYLIDPRNEKEERYDKVRLVSFGEYVPWRKFFNLFGLERLAYSLGVGDFEAGSGIKIFSLRSSVIASQQSLSFPHALGGNPKSGSPTKTFGDDKKREILRFAQDDSGALNAKKFAVLICFEDTFPYLARRAVYDGAQFLIVITNDAWFSKSASPYQHLQASIFRAIENGVPVIRAANTGVSAIITNQGKVLERVKDPQGNDTFIAGGISGLISLTSGRTFYQKYGYLFPYFCLLFIGIGFILGPQPKK